MLNKAIDIANRHRVCKTTSDELYFLENYLLKHSKEILHVFATAPGILKRIDELEDASKASRPIPYIEAMMS